jgi:hypothetical protein
MLKKMVQPSITASAIVIWSCQRHANVTKDIPSCHGPFGLKTNYWLRARVRDVPCLSLMGESP